MSATFSKIIQTDKGSKIFNFIFAAGIEGIGYAITVENKPGNNIQFLMKEERGERWVIISQNLPLWISNVELELSNLIERNL